MERRGEKRIKILRNKDFKTFLFADNQGTVTDAEDALRIFIHKLETVTSRCDQKFPMEEGYNSENKFLLNSNI